MAGRRAVAGMTGEAARAPAANPASDAAFRRKHREPAAPVIVTLANLAPIARRAERLRSQARRRAAAEEAIPPTPQQLGRNIYETVQVKDPDACAARFVKRNTTGRNLERWRARDLIGDREFDAGERYRTTFEMSGWLPRVTARYGVFTGGGEPTPPGPSTHQQMDAWNAWRTARAEIAWPLREGFDLLVLHDMGMSDVANDSASDPAGIFGPRSGLPAVAVALLQLATFYRL